MNKECYINSVHAIFRIIIEPRDTSIVDLFRCWHKNRSIPESKAFVQSTFISIEQTNQLSK